MTSAAKKTPRTKPHAATRALTKAADATVNGMIALAALEFYGAARAAYAAACKVYRERDGGDSWSLDGCNDDPAWVAALEAMHTARAGVDRVADAAHAATVTP